jgi:hypothetical protein
MARLNRSLIAAGVCLGAFLAPATAAYALWSTTATGTVQVSVATPSPAGPSAPTSLKCDKVQPRDVLISWTGSAVRYRLVATFAGGSLTFDNILSQSQQLTGDPDTNINGAKDVTVTVTAFDSNNAFATSGPIGVKWNNGNGWTCLK